MAILTKHDLKTGVRVSATLPTARGVVSSGIIKTRSRPRGSISGISSATSLSGRRTTLGASGLTLPYRGPLPTSTGRSRVCLPTHGDVTQTTCESGSGDLVQLTQITTKMPTFERGTACRWVGIGSSLTGRTAHARSAFGKRRRSSVENVFRSRSTTAMTPAQSGDFCAVAATMLSGCLNTMSPCCSVRRNIYQEKHHA